MKTFSIHTGKKSHLGDFIILIVLLGLGNQTVTGILRNPATDRCIHVGKSDRSDHSRFTVAAHPCSFRNPKTGRGENLDGVEVVSTSKLPQVKKYTIQKHFPEEYIVCVQVRQDETITMGDCKLPSSILVITKIPDQHSSYEGMSSGTIFTIGQSNSNKCISVTPGMSELQLTNCSEANAFQRWITCRPGGTCDVDITWSPARIIFPKDPFNSSRDFENVEPTVLKQTQKPIQIKDKSELHPSQPVPITVTSPPTSSSTPTVHDNDHSQPKIIINELLYFVHNSLNVMKLPESKLISVVSNFYTTEEVQDALDTLKDNFFAIHIDPRSVSVQTTVQILHWMKQILNHELDSNIIFASQRLSRIPPISEINSSHNHAPSPGDWKNIRNLRGRVETNINSIMERLEDLKADVLSNLEQKNSSEVSTMDGGGISNEKQDGEEMVDAIDLRLKQNAKTNYRHRYYE